MPDDKPPLPTVGQEELAVLQFIQQSPAVTVREVADHFASAGKARTTVLTVMERLRSKGLLEREKVGGAYRYSCCVETSDVVHSLIGDFVQGILGGSLSPFTAYMSQSNDISDEELKQLKRLVRDLEKQRRDER